MKAALARRHNPALFKVIIAFWDLAVRPCAYAEWLKHVTGMEPMYEQRLQAELATPSTSNLTELVTERQVSNRWNISLNTLRYWRSVGEGPPYVKMGRSVRYNVAALERFLRRHTCESKTRATAEEVFQHVAH
jgi:hypothetical protein